MSLVAAQAGQQGIALQGAEVVVRHMQDRSTRALYGVGDLSWRSGLVRAWRVLRRDRPRVGELPGRLEARQSNAPACSGPAAPPQPLDSALNLNQKLRCSVLLFFLRSEQDVEKIRFKGTLLPIPFARRTAPANPCHLANRLRSSRQRAVSIRLSTPLRQFRTPVQPWGFWRKMGSSLPLRGR